MKAKKSNRPLLIGVLVLIVIAAAAYVGVVVRSQVLELTATAPVRYSLSLAPPAIKLHQVIRQPALSQDPKLEAVKFFTETLTLRVTHVIGLGFRTSILELTKKDNPAVSDELSEDIKVNFIPLAGQGMSLTAEQIKLSFLASPFVLTGVEAKVFPKKEIVIKVKDVKFDSPKGKLSFTGVDFRYNEKEEKLSVNIQDASIDNAKLTDVDLEVIKKENVTFKGTYREEEFAVSLNFEKMTKEGVTLPIVSGIAEIPRALATTLTHKYLDGALKTIRDEVAKSPDPMAIKKFDLAKELMQKKSLYVLMDRLIPGVKFKRTSKSFVFNRPKVQALARAENDFARLAYFSALAEKLKKLPLAEGVNEALYLLVASTYEDQVRTTIEAYLEHLKKESKDTIAFKLLSIHHKLYNSQTGNVSNEMSSPIWEESALTEAKEIYKQASAEAPQDKLTLWLAARLAHNKDDKANLILFYDKLAELETDPARKKFWQFHKMFWINDPALLQVAPELLKLNPSREMASYVTIQYAYQLDQKTHYPQVYEALKRAYDDRILPARNRTRFVSFLTNNDHYSEAQPYIDKCYEEESDQSKCDELQLSNTYLTANQQRMSDRFEEAKKLFDECLLMDPTDADVQVSLGHIVKSQNGPDPAKHWALGCALGRSDMCKFQSVKDYLAR